MVSNKKPVYFPETHYIQISKPSYSKRVELKGPKRVLKLFVLCALLPAILLVVPLYLRYRVYIQQVYPLAVTDMRIVDSKISTTWCQKQLIISNTTFNAYVIASEPRISKNYENVEMRRSIILKDGVKEYWGFYLLKGSSFKVSACVRWPGASLIVIEGHRHLKECAYVGDNSSEETEGSKSSEENQNLTTINQMTKLSPGIVLNSWDDDKLSNPNPPQRADKMQFFNTKTRNFHLKYAEELFRNESGKTSKTETKNTNDSVKEVVNIMQQLKKLQSQGVVLPEESQNGTQTGRNATSGALLLHRMYETLLQHLYENNNSKNTKKSEYSAKADNANEFRKLKSEILFQRSKNLNITVDNEANTGQEVFDDDAKEDVHGSVKPKKDGDRSKSEYWSSFSSSEELLLNCSGLLVSLPLIPHNSCEQKFDDIHLEGVAEVNSVSYEVKKTGYYFFIFNNENEVETNFIHAHFELKKAVYDTSDAVVSCKNETKECILPLTFWSGERTVLELPPPSDDSQWNEEFVFVSRCEPRSTLYLICILMVPVCILLFAFS